jgi:hypothetical protein
MAFNAAAVVLSSDHSSFYPDFEEMRGEVDIVDLPQVVPMRVAGTTFRQGAE